MSHHDDNLYTILGKLAALQPTAKEKHDATVKQIYESVEAKGSVLAGVSAVEAQLNEKYMGFKNTVSALKKQGGVDNPEGLAASIGRKKYGKAKFQKAAAAGKKLGEADAPHPVELDMIGKTRELGVQNRTKAVMAKNAQQAAEPKNAWQHTKKVIGEPLKKLAKGDVKGALSENDDDLFGNKSTKSIHPPTNALALLRWAKITKDPKKHYFALIARFALENGLTLRQAYEITDRFEDWDDKHVADDAWKNFAVTPQEMSKLFNAYDQTFHAWWDYSKGGDANYHPWDIFTENESELEEGPIADKVKKGVAAAAMVGLGATAMNPDNYSHKTPTPAQAKAQQAKPKVQEGDVVHKGRYGNDGKDYTGKTGGNPKVQDDPTNTKFDTKGIAGMIGKKTGNKDIGKVSHRQKHEWDNSPEDVAEEFDMDAEGWEFPQGGRYGYMLGGGGIGYGSDNQFSTEGLSVIDSQTGEVVEHSDFTYFDDDPTQEDLEYWFNEPPTDNYEDDIDEGKDPFANVDPRVSKPTIPGTKNKAKSAYYPSNKPGQVKKLDKPTSKYDNIKNESRKLQIAEGINFAEMMKETDSTVAEMLNELQKDINSFKQTGHCSDKLEAFLKVHNHGKKLMGEAVPKGPSFAPQDAISLDKAKPFEPSRIQGTKPGVGSRAVSAAVDIAKKGIDALTGPDDAGHLQNLKDKMYKEDAALNELARLAGLKVDESEEVCMECGMYESKCSCEKCME